MNLDDLRPAPDWFDRRTAQHLAGVGVFLLIYALLLRGVVIGSVYAFGDFSPYYGMDAFDKFLGTWHFQQLGDPYIYNVLPAYMGTVTLIGGALAQNLFYLLLLPIGFLTFVTFAGRFVESVPARYLGAGLYAINPLTIGEFVNGGIAALIGFAGLPLVLHYLYAVVERDDWTDVLKCGAVFGATTVSPWLGFWMVAPFAVYLAGRARHNWVTLGRLFMAGIIGVILALPSLHHVLPRIVGLEDTTGRSALLASLKWNYAYTDPLAVLRLAGNRGVMAMNELGYNTEPVMTVGLVIPAVALVAWRRRELHVYYAIATLIVAFIVLTAMGLTYGLFDTVPVLLSVRNPVKLQYPLLICLSVLFAAGTEIALSGYRDVTDPPLLSSDGGVNRGTDRLTSTVLVAVLVISLFAYAMPAVGALGLESVRGDDYYIDEDQDAVTSGLDGRILWVPYGYTTQLHLRHTNPRHVGIKSGGFLHGISNVDFVSSLFRDLATGEPVHEQLADLGVKYVVVDRDPPGGYGRGSPRLVQKWGAPWIFGDPATFDQRFRSSPAYALESETNSLRVYRVKGVERRNRSERRQGLHAVLGPTERSVEPLGENRLVNPSFANGTEGWWTPPNTDNRTIQPINDGDGAVSIRVSSSAKPLPVAQATTVRPEYPYQLSVDADGEGVVGIYWYDGEATSENLVSRQSIPLDSQTTLVFAEGNQLSIRIRPDGAGNVTLRHVSIRRSTYPPTTSAPSRQGVPGVVIDGRENHPSAATTVAVNLNDAAASDADVRLVDAETVLGGELVFDDRYRQGVGIKLNASERPDTIPEDARLVTYETDDGIVLDYWVVGTFDDDPVTVLRTSYDEQWVSESDSQHFRAYGWANGFTNATSSDIHWAGGSFRRLVVGTWGVAWITVSGILAAVRLVPLWQRRRRTDD